MVAHLEAPAILSVSTRSTPQSGAIVRSVNCLHVVLEEVELIHRLDGKELRGGPAMHCKDCQQNWPYRNPEDLPYWLYMRLKDQGRLPMPELTPRIIEALRRDNDQLSDERCG